MSDSASIPEQWPKSPSRIASFLSICLVASSFQHFNTALDVFQRLGARPWAVRATNEMRALGRTRTKNEYAPIGVLTPQERQIALMAASGMSNKQIGERLFLSHRTVGTHLYRAFPKLGITSRAALRDALTEGSRTTCPPETRRAR